MVIYFITFAAGAVNYAEAAVRLIGQADATKLFNKTILYDDTYLKSQEDFWDTHSEFIEKNPRGYGYWIWKPYIIKKTMEQLADGDILLYLDSGCEIDINKKNILKAFLEFIKSEYIIGSFVSREKLYNKMDLVVKLGMLHPSYMDKMQHQGGAILFKVCKKTRELVNEWYELACDYHLIDDTPSVCKEIDGFQEHRHDQSIFSLLTKKYKIYSNKNICDAIEYKRNRSGISKC